MNELEQNNLLQTEAKTSDELSAEDLGEIAGGCGENKGGYSSTYDFWKRTDHGPNILRHIAPRRGSSGQPPKSTLPGGI